MHFDLNEIFQSDIFVTISNLIGVCKQFDLILINSRVVHKCLLSKKACDVTPEVNIYTFVAAQHIWHVNEE